MPARAAAPWAALVNGTAAHVLEIDDNYYPALTHASAVLLPALLALGDELDADSTAVLHAYLVGLELHAVLGRGVNRSHYFAGWHPTATVGCIGTAGACARLLGLDAEATRNAMSLAVSMAAGNKAQFGTEAKSVQCGLGASHAVQAARLGAAGVQGNPDVLEDPQGFMALYSGPQPRGWAEPLRILDNPLAMWSHGLAPKRHACCGSAHNAIDCVLDLQAAHGFDADDVEAVDVLVGASNKRNLGYDDPQDALQARLSMHYNLALALLFGALTLADFTPQAVQRAPVRQLMRRVTMRVRAFEDEPKDPDDRPPHVVQIVLKDGRRLHAQRMQARGLIQDPFTDEERLRKLRGCLQPSLSPEACERLIGLLLNVGQGVAVREITGLWHG